MGLSEPTCKCGHETRWHGDLGCGYLGWSYGKPKCGCRLTDSEVVRQIVTAALTEAADAIVEARPEGARAEEPGNWKRGERHGRLRAANIVRAQIPPP